MLFWSSYSWLLFMYLAKGVKNEFRRTTVGIFDEEVYIEIHDEAKMTSVVVPTSS